MLRLPWIFSVRVKILAQSISLTRSTLQTVYLHRNNLHHQIRFPEKKVRIFHEQFDVPFAFTVFIIQQFILKHFETMFIMNKYTCESDGACISFSKVHCYAPRNCELSEAKNEHFSMVFISIFTQNFLFRLNERCETGSHTPYICHVVQRCCARRAMIINCWFLRSTVWFSSYLRASSLFE